MTKASNIIRRKIVSAQNLHSVVKTMKGLATINIQQYERTLLSLEDYFYTLELGLTALMGQSRKEPLVIKPQESNLNMGVIVIGSDQGMVGQFTEDIVQFSKKELDLLNKNVQIWPIGEITYHKLKDFEIQVNIPYRVPDSVSGITSVVGDILHEISEKQENKPLDSLFLIYNRPDQHRIYVPTKIRLLPIDNLWIAKFQQKKWPTNKLPEILIDDELTFSSLIQEYIFVSLFKVCTESMASENSQRLYLMQKAEKNIENLLDDLNRRYHRIRQDSIDQELFDIVAEFEALVKS